MCGADQPGTGVLAGAVRSMAAAVERHQIPTFSLLARCLVAAEETARPAELPVCCSSWGVQPLPSTPYHHTTQAHQCCLRAGTGLLYFNLLNHDVIFTTLNSMSRWPEASLRHLPFRERELQQEQQKH